MLTVAPSGPTFPTLAHGVPSALTQGGGGSAEAAGATAIAAAAAPANRNGVIFVSFAIMVEAYHDREVLKHQERLRGSVISAR